MKKIFTLTILLTLSLLAVDLTDKLESSLKKQNTEIDLNEQTLVALNCIKPIRPILPIKPVWCSGTWTQILRCDQNCNCIWEPVCLQ